MTTQEQAWQAAEAAIAALAPEASEFASLDAAGFGEATASVLMRAAVHPGHLAAALTRYTTSLLRIGPAAAARWVGLDAEPPVAEPSDKRFADRTWSDNPAFFALRQAYLAAVRLNRDVLAAGAGDPKADLKADLATGFLFDALAPTNFLFTNPAALKRVFETGGTSLAAGTANFLYDVRTNGGRPRQVDMRPFKIGENLAATPGQVVFKNDLMELIQYAPQTAKVRSVPVLASPPWIR